MSDFGKNDWVELFREIGLDDPTMHRWHARFEARYPKDHARFLEWLKIDPNEVERIRAASRDDWRDQ